MAGQRWGVRSALAMLALGLAVTTLGVTTAHGKGVQPRVEKLDNGLELILVERHETPTVAGMVAYDVGSVNDPRGQSGIAHLFEHMLFKGSTIIGTNNYDAEKSLIADEEKLRVQMNDEMNRMREMKRRGKIGDVLDPSQWTPVYTEMKKRFDDLVVKHREFIKNNELFNLYTTNGGAGLNAGTSHDFTIYHVQLPSNKLELFFWLESDRMQNGIMREFYVERDNVREERRLRVESTPTGKLNEAFEALFWQSHPYGVPVLGWASEVESITAQDVRDFYKIYYAPNNAKLVLVGDFDTHKVVEMAKRYFGRIPKGATPPAPIITEEAAPVAERRFYGEAETNTRVEIRFPGVALGHADDPALNVVAQLLSGKSGRLFNRLVTKEDATIGQPFAGSSARKYAGYFEISAVVKDGKEPEAVEKMLLEEIAKLRDGEITDHELQKVKNQVLAQSVQQLRSNRGLMFQLAISELWYDWSYVNELPELMMKVTADDVHRVLKTYFDPTVRTVAVYRTKKKPGSAPSISAGELDAALASLAPVGAAKLKAQLAQLKESTDATKISADMQKIEQLMATEGLKESQKKVLKITLNAMKVRLAELQSTTKESK